MRNVFSPVLTAKQYQKRSTETNSDAFLSVFLKVQPEHSALISAQPWVVFTSECFHSSDSSGWFDISGEH